MIQVQYWTPVARKHINMVTYVGWSKIKGNVLREDRTWSSTKCSIKSLEATLDSKVAIPIPQINIIKAFVRAFTTDSVDGASSSEV